MAKRSKTNYAYEIAKNIWATCHADMDPNKDLLEQILKMHWDYRFANGARNSGVKVEFEEPVGHEHNGIMFYSVGNNASHHFSLGVKDGKMFRMSSYCDYHIDPETGKDVDINEINVTEITGNDTGYIGHH